MSEESKWVVLGSALLILILSFGFTSAYDVVERTSYEDYTRIDITHYDYPESSLNPFMGAKVPSPSDISTDPSCYKFIAPIGNDLPIKLIINPTNDQNISLNSFKKYVSKSAKVWDKETSQALFDYDNFSISLDARAPVRDSKNVVTFYDRYPNWYIVGQTSLYLNNTTGKIFEFDILLNSKVPFGDAEENPNVVDLESTLVHEFGHGLGLADVYDFSCYSATMYPYIYFGYINKRTLETPDIEGLRVLYPSSNQNY